jgi:AbrB family looped-hinge helix DNA binding protein
VPVVEMETATVTTKGQVIIPSRIRLKLGIKKGTRVTFIEKDGEIIFRPISDDFIKRMAGFARNKGELLIALKFDKERERDL